MHVDYSRAVVMDETNKDTNEKLEELLDENFLDF